MKTSSSASGHGSLLPISRSVVVVAMAIVVMMGALLTAKPAEAATRVDYSKRCGGYFVASVHVYGYDRNVTVSVEPTGIARWLGRFEPGMWDDIWRCVGYPSGLYGWQGDSMYKQLYCHAQYSLSVPGLFSTGGATWDLESWRPNVSWWRATQVWSHKCNWNS